MRCAILPLTILLLTMSGCQALGFVASVFAPPQKMKTVQPEYDKLPGHSIAVVTLADAGVDYLYPRGRLDLSNTVAQELRGRVQNVKVLPAQTVLAYQRGNQNWESMPKDQLAKALGVDYVLYLALEEYAMSDPGNSQLFRAHITADANLYKADAKDAAPVWTGRIRLVHPETETGEVIPGSDDRPQRAEAHTIFSLLLVRKFYKHEVPENQ